MTKNKNYFTFIDLCHIPYMQLTIIYIPIRHKHTLDNNNSTKLRDKKATSVESMYDETRVQYYTA